MADPPISEAANYLQEYSGHLWKQGQHERSIAVGKASAALTAAGISEMEVELERLRAVVEAARKVSDSNFRRLEASLRKSGWAEQANMVQEFRKLLEDYEQAIALAARDAALSPREGEG